MSNDLSPVATSDTEKRDQLRMKIEASERRVAERTVADQAKEAAQAAADYTRANPLTVIGGAVVIGIAIGLMTKPGRRVAATAASSAADKASDAASAAGNAASGAAKSVSNSVNKVAKNRMAALGVIISDALIDYGIKWIDELLGGARSGQDALEDIGDSAAAKARSLRRDAGYIAGSAVDKGRAATVRTRRRAERVVKDLTDRARG